MKELCEKLIRAKEVEAFARQARIEAEEAIIKEFGKLKPEGTTTKTDGFYKVAVTTKLGRELDYEAYQALDLGPDFGFIDLKPSINIKRLRMMEAIDPALVARCVTSKPLKTSVKVEEVTQ